MKKWERWLEVLLPVLKSLFQSGVSPAVVASELELYRLAKLANDKRLKAKRASTR